MAVLRKTAAAVLAATVAVFAVYASVCASRNPAAADSHPVVVFQITPSSITEGETLTLRVSGVLPDELADHDTETVLAVSVRDGTASAGSDFSVSVPEGFAVVWVSKQSMSADRSVSYFDMTANADSIEEGAETVLVSADVSPLDGFRVRAAMITIRDSPPADTDSDSDRDGESAPTSSTTSSTSSTTAEPASPTAASTSSSSTSSSSTSTTTSSTTVSPSTTAIAVLPREITPPSSSSTTTSTSSSTTTTTTAQPPTSTSTTSSTTTSSSTTTTVAQPEDENPDSPDLDSEQPSGPPQEDETPEEPPEPPTEDGRPETLDPPPFVTSPPTTQPNGKNGEPETASLPTEPEERDSEQADQPEEPQQASPSSTSTTTTTSPAGPPEEKQTG